MMRFGFEGGGKDGVERRKFSVRFSTWEPECIREYSTYTFLHTHTHAHVPPAKCTPDQLHVNA